MIGVALLLGFGFGFLVAFLKSKGELKAKSLECELLKEKLSLMEALQKSFSDHFKTISSEALKQSNETFLQIAEKNFEKYQEKAKSEFDKKSQAIDELVKPVKQALEKMDGKVAELEKARIGAYVSIKEQIHSLFETQKELKSETSNLVKALRAPQIRGRWGEIQLKRVVEMAGMLERCDFFEQVTAVKEEGRLRPDLLVKLPGEKNIIVDAKAPLEAYLEAIQTSDEDKKRFKMKEHAEQIRTHVTALSRKSYWEQFQPTPEFVILFLPGETFFSAALEHDPALIEAGVEERVILATPTTLIALLRAVHYGWKQENISKNAEHISLLGRELYKRISDMSAHFSKMGKSLKNAVADYNSAIGSLESRVLVSARRFEELEEITEKKGLEHLEPVEKEPRALRAFQGEENLEK